MSKPPEPSPDEPLITWLSPEDFDALVERLDQPAVYDPAIAKTLAALPPWERSVDNQVDNEMDRP